MPHFCDGTRKHRHVLGKEKPRREFRYMHRRRRWKRQRLIIEHKTEGVSFPISIGISTVPYTYCKYVLLIFICVAFRLRPWLHLSLSLSSHVPTLLHHINRTQTKEKLTKNQPPSIPIPPRLSTISASKPNNGTASDNCQIATLTLLIDGRTPRVFTLRER